MNSDKNAYFLSLPEITELSVPPKTILLEEGKVADRNVPDPERFACACFSTTKDGHHFPVLFRRDFVASFDSLYQRTP